MADVHTYVVVSDRLILATYGIRRRFIANVSSPLRLMPR